MSEASILAAGGSGILHTSLTLFGIGALIGPKN